MAKSAKRAWTVKICVFLIITAGLLLSLIWQQDINRALKLTKVSSSEYGGTTSGEVIDGSANETDALNIHFVDVGQGDSTIIELPDGKKMIVDGGKDKEKTKLLSYIEENIKDETGGPIDGFDYAVLTHSDEDHCGGLDDVLNLYPADVFYRPNILASYSGYDDPAAEKIKAKGKYKEHKTKAYKQALEAAYTEKTEVIITDANDDNTSLIEPESVLPGSELYYSITFYAPTENYFSNVNDYSPVMILEYQDKKIALSGDAEEAEEQSFVSKAKAGEGKYSVFDDNYGVNVIKLGHHGSRTASSDEYLQTLTAGDCGSVFAVASCGMNNSYGHPHKEVTDRLLDLGFKEENILITANNGTIAMSVYGGKFYLGAQLIRFETASATVGPIKMQWREIVILLIITAAFALIITPAVRQYRAAAKKAERAASRKSNRKR